MGQPAAPAPYAAAGATAAFISTWLKVWVAVLGVVTLVVVIYLVGITQTLEDINDNLATVDNAVTDVGGETKTLPRLLGRPNCAETPDSINCSLVNIDNAVKPVRAGVEQIQAAVQSVDTSLRQTNDTLSPSPPGTGGFLTSARDKLVRTDAAVENADRPDGLGVPNIHQRVAAVNGPGGGPTTGPFGRPAENLVSVRADTQEIAAILVDVNKHVRSICERLAALTLPQPPPPAPPVGVQPGPC